MPTHETDRVMEQIREQLAGRTLIVVSNREPYEHRTTGRGPAASPGAGGLAAALDAVMRAIGGTWVAWGSGEADFLVTDASHRIGVPPGAPRYTLKRIALPAEEVEGYYRGYANQALWPLCHMALHHVRFSASHWAAYRAANRRFAEAVQAEAPPGALIWTHDYHLALCPRVLRRMRKDVFLMHFWHIPWPVWDVFRICPQRAELLDGLLANDLLVFQRSRDAEHFLDAAVRTLGVRVRAGDRVNHKGRLTQVRALPISVDAGALDALARSSDCRRWMARLARHFRLTDRAVVLSVDRLDYTKGILHRLRAIEAFLEGWPAYRGRVVFVQKAAPSRTQIDAYRDLQRQVESRIDRINATYRTRDWTPVLYLATPLPRAAVAALYRMARVCLVSSLQDGMNLVAKEFVACQVDGRGALLLSEFAGACDELPGALPVNPYDTEGSAERLRAALEMPREERQRAMARCRAYLAEHDVYRWVSRNLDAAASSLAGREAVPHLLDARDELRRAVLSRGRRLALLLDFDGTLAPFDDDPDRVRTPAQAEAALHRLARIPRTLLAIISGRSLRDIRARIAIPGLLYAGNHGLEIAGPGWTWVLPEARSRAQAIAACCDRLERRVRRVPGAWVENKGLTASVHVRRTRPGDIPEVEAAVRDAVAAAAPSMVRVCRARDVLEIRPDVPWGKGEATRWLLAHCLGGGWRSSTTVVYIGDDDTDEEAFRALAGAAMTVRVGPPTRPTAARHRVCSVGEVHQFLAMVAEWLGVSRRVPSGPARQSEDALGVRRGDLAAGL